jgi:hypothetical protein
MLRTRMGVAAVLIAAAVTFMSIAPASAHEHRVVGSSKFVVGWISEPTYLGVRNGVQLFLTDAAGKPITDLGITLRVQLDFQGTKSKALPLVPAFNATSGRSGEYYATVFPTRAGTYTFHFTGTVHGEPVDQSFTSSDHTFNDASSAVDREFPVKDPSAAELATKLIAGNRQAGAATNQATGAATLATAGIVVGTLGLLAGAFGLVSALTARRRSNR